MVMCLTLHQMCNICGRRNHSQDEHHLLTPEQFKHRRASFASWHVGILTRRGSGSLSEDWEFQPAQEAPPKENWPTDEDEELLTVTLEVPDQRVLFKEWRNF